MFDFVSVLAKNPNGVLATKKGDKLATRVFQYLFADGNKVYFCTSSEKPVYRQLIEDANVSFCTFPSDYSPVISVNGRVTFIDDAALKARALDENPSIKAIYKSADNPVFKLFYINAHEIETFSFSEGPKTYAI